METVVTYKGRDNSFTLEFTKDKVTLTPVEMGVITKFEIQYNGTYYNSIDNPTGFEITAATGKVKILPNKLDLAVSSGSGDITEVIVYDDVNTAGLLWAQIMVKVKHTAIPGE